MFAAPSEVNIAGVYVPPLLVAGILGLSLTYCLVKALDRFRLSRHFAAPELVFVALVVIVSVIIEAFVVIG
ncbi:DUF1656 domain-containing protein [Solidesulfovibrio sp.]|uniref:DUF1656 domain-containing protein n=1 Tax=Solidesulfovibrio sp. TaxID=2910990 RepID=UPI00261FE5A1|nr:DUF1656 domain-containing protein [Solidesulfovibrio sp.]